MDVKNTVMPLYVSSSCYGNVCLNILNGLVLVLMKVLVILTHRKLVFHLCFLEHCL